MAAALPRLASDKRLTSDQRKTQCEMARRRRDRVLALLEAHFAERRTLVRNFKTGWGRGRSAAARELLRLRRDLRLAKFARTIRDAGWWAGLDSEIDDPHEVLVRLIERRERGA